MHDATQSGVVHVIAGQNDTGKLPQVFCLLGRFRQSHILVSDLTSFSMYTVEAQILSFMTFLF